MNGSRALLRRLLVAGAPLLGLAAACTPNATPAPESTAPAPVVAFVGVTHAAETPARRGMAWIPPGEVKAGTPPSKWPRIADEELPGTPFALNGFFIDELPFPNEPGAIPVANVSRDDAARMCEEQGKRLCSELEWERACKGPADTMYEYGDAYRADRCRTGVAPSHAARRPTGELNACRSGFDVREMHGGVYEWTRSPWQRGGPSRLAVLKGGNAVAGEIVGRCSNALGRLPTTRSATTGFRCCAGPLNEAEVVLPASEPKPTLERLAVAHADPVWGPMEWAWRPVPGEELRIRGACDFERESPRIASCSCEVGRPQEPASARIETGKALCGILQPTKDARDLRMIYMAPLGRSRTVRYAYGRVVVSDAR